MAWTKDNARDEVKKKLDIGVLAADTTFDTIVANCVEQATPRMANFYKYPIAENTSVTLATDDDSFTLPVAGSTLVSMKIRTSTNEVWREFELWSQHGDKIYLHEPINTTTYVKVLAKRELLYDDTDLGLLPVPLRLSLMLYAMAEFFSYIVGNKRKFNIYQQMSGVRTVDEMAELVTFNENRAERVAENYISSEGM